MNNVELFRRRFAGMLIPLLWANAVILCFAPTADGAIIAFGCGLAMLTTLVWSASRTGWVTHQISSCAAVAQVMLLVYGFKAHAYQVDIHMYFFAMLAVLAGWLDWRIFLPATVAIALHHLVLSFLYPAAVFPNGSESEMSRVALHAVIVIIQASALSWAVHALKHAIRSSESEQRQANEAREAADAARRESADTTTRAEIERRQTLYGLATDFERTVAGIARDLIASIQSLRDSSQQMSSGAAEVSAHSQAASASSRQTTANARAISHATAELARSFAQVDRQVEEATRVVAQTTEQAAAVLAKVSDLSRKADEISDISGAISAIAQQTNLLALNAAIEAARLGQSGGGFKVVAQEIKSLATQTWRATEDIQGQVDAIHLSGQEAAVAIDAMNLTIGSLNAISGKVAAVVEQQNASAADIADWIDRVAGETAAAGEHIEHASTVAGDTGKAAQHVAHSADALSSQSQQLDWEVAQFVGHIRAS